MALVFVITALRQLLCIKNVEERANKEKKGEHVSFLYRRRLIGYVPNRLIIVWHRSRFMCSIKKPESPSPSADIAESFFLMQVCDVELTSNQFEVNK